MVTFNVDNVQPGKMREFRTDSKKNINSLVGTGMEGSSVTDELTFSSNNLIAAVNTAYDAHLPLVLSPDMLWLTLSQGFSHHINNNAEALRHQFVQHEGKEKIEIFENSFIKGGNNDWPHAFGQFSSAIKDYIGKKHDLIVSSFSTTGPVELAASEIVLMEAMQAYFSYEMTTCCGIPNITLLGTKEDWANIRGRVQAMAEFDLGWWAEKLEPIVDEFVAAANGNVNKVFWQNIYKTGGGSGGPYLSGWIVDLFPYLMAGGKPSHRNTFKHSAGMGSGPTTSAFPKGLAKAPFIWNYYDQKFNMELAAGFTGMKTDESGAVVPQIGWAVRDVDAFTTIKASFKAPSSSNRDWTKESAMRTEFETNLKSLGFEELGWSYGTDFFGNLPKNNLKAAKNIPGLDVKESSKDE